MAVASGRRDKPAVNKYLDKLRGALRAGDSRKLVEALALVPAVVEEAVQAVQADLRKALSRIEEVESGVKDLISQVEKIADSVNELSERQAEQNRRISRMELTVGGLAEALLSRVVVEELASQGYVIKARQRNFRVDNEDIDLVVTAEREGREEHFIVEIKIKPTHSDVGALVAKSDLYSVKVGVQARPILASVWVGREVEAYAKSKNVLVIKI